MIRLILNKILPVLSDREMYGLELESLKKKKKRVEKKITSLHNKSVYLDCRIKGLEDTIDTIRGEAEDRDPVDNTPILGG